MECCICYNNIKKSSITCHDLCKKCYDKIQNKKCPICRNKMNLLIITSDKFKHIEVEYSYKNTKFIFMKNLKRFVFGKDFKNHLTNVLNRTEVRYKTDFIIINFKKYNYDEILDFKAHTDYMIWQNNIYNYRIGGFENLINRLITNQNISKIDLFYIKNAIVSEYETYNSRLLKYIWETKNLK